MEQPYLLLRFLVRWRKQEANKLQQLFTKSDYIINNSTV